MLCLASESMIRVLSIAPVLDMHWLSLLTQGVESTLFQCWASVYDAGPTLKHRWINALCLLGCCFDFLWHCDLSRTALTPIYEWCACVSVTRHDPLDGDPLRPRRHTLKITIPGKSYKSDYLNQERQNIHITFRQCWTNIEEVGPPLYKCYTNVVCLLGNYL